MSAADVTVRYAFPPVLAQLGRRHAVVEASAGTGKTYLLEHLVVDLVLRAGVELEQILVVTFTEKATAELQHRVRAKLAELVALRPDDPAAIAGAAADEAHTWRLDAHARERLRRALRAFDRASISTIHGYCQRVLASHAFANGRLFREEAVEETEAFATAFRETLRRDLAVDATATELFEALRAAGGSLDGLQVALLRAHQRMAALHPPRADALRAPPMDDVALAAALAAWPDEATLATVPATLRQLGANCQVAHMAKHLAAVSAVVHGLRERPTLVATLVALSELEPARDYLRKYAGDEEDARLSGHDVIARFAAAFRRLDALACCGLQGALVQRLLPAVRDRLEANKRKAGVFDFQDMLTLVARAVDDEGPRGRALVAALRTLHRHALVDEAQDTDEVQWRIFERLFLESPDGHVLTLVGDPKQAIYSFRGADVHTYLTARDAIAARGEPAIPLVRNFRSSEALIDATNALLAQDAPAPFFRADGPIRYDHPVSCGRHELSLLDGDGRPAAPLVVLDVGGDGAPARPRAWQVRASALHGIVDELRLLLDPERGFELVERAGPRRLRPGDVFVLTRKNWESREVGEALRAAGIPFAYYKQERLFETVEAQDVLDLLRAIVDPDDVTARARAFITPFFGLTLPELTACDPAALAGTGHALLDRLYGWAALAQEGAYERLFARVIDDSGVVCRDLFFGRGERRITNYLHLFELLQDEAARTRATPRELADRVGGWLRGTRRPPGRDSDVQRLETDADAVQIMTIHQSKGLEAAVVFLYGGISPPPASSVFAYHGADGARVVQVGKPSLADERRHRHEQDDEERRVYYVALTRARARLVVPHYPQSFSARGAYPFVDARVGALLADVGLGVHRGPVDVRRLPCPPPTAEAPRGTPQALATWQPPADLVPSAGSDASDDLRAAAHARAGFVVTSYSAIKRVQADVPDAAPTDDAAASDVPQAPRGETPADELPPGRLTGTFLHELLELVPLEPLAARPDLTTWSARADVRTLVDRVTRRHDRDPRHAGHAARLVHTAFVTPVPLGDGSIDGLASATVTRRELEFLFPIPERTHPLLARAAEAGRFTIGRGVVKGFIDLLFVHEGRGYVCDWKTDALPDFSPARLEAHATRAYDVQARLYAIAALRVLDVTDEASYEARFGGVLFCFLRGMDPAAPGAGVRFQRPRWADVLAWERDMLSDGFWGLA